MPLYCHDEGRDALYLKPIEAEMVRAFFLIAGLAMLYPVLIDSASFAPQAGNAVVLASLK